jgi:hypothetical protein
LLDKKLGNPIHLGLRAQAAESQCGGRLSLHQTDDDFAPTSQHGAWRMFAARSQDTPLTNGNALPNPHYPFLNFHEELLSLVSSATTRK